MEKLGNHTPSGGLRGGKYSLFEGGAKVPFIAYWQGKIKPSVSNALICQIDFMATLAKLVGTATPANDSQEFLNVLLGKSNKGRTDLILEASGKLAYRQGNYAFIPPYKGKPVHVDVNIELGISPNFQVYNLYLDPAQIKDLSKLEPKKLEELKKGMLKIAGNAFQINQTELELK